MIFLEYVYTRCINIYRALNFETYGQAYSPHIMQQIWATTIVTVVKIMWGRLQWKQQHESNNTKSQSLKKWDLRGVSDHARTCKVGFDWEETIVLQTEEKRFERKVREALEIQLQQTSPRRDHGLNQDDGLYVTISFWKPMFTHIREKTLKWCDVKVDVAPFPFL